MYCAVVTICTASLTFNNSMFCSHSVFVCFVWISEQTAIISLHNINWLVCITDTECVYCAVRTGSLYMIQVHLGLIPHTRYDLVISSLVQSAVPLPSKRLLLADCHCQLRPFQCRTHITQLAITDSIISLSANHKHSISKCSFFVPRGETKRLCKTA